MMAHKAAEANIAEAWPLAVGFGMNGTASFSLSRLLQYFSCRLSSSIISDEEGGREDVGVDGGRSSTIKISDGDYFPLDAMWRNRNVYILAPSALLCRNARIDMGFVEIFAKVSKKQGLIHSTNSTCMDRRRRRRRKRGGRFHA